MAMNFGNESAMAGDPEYSKADHFSDQWRFYAWVSLPFLVFGATGNVLVLLSIVHKAGQRRPLLLVLFCQFFADFILSAIVFPANAIAVLTNHIASDFVADVFGWLFVVGQTSATIAICAVAVNRVVAIIYFLELDKVFQYRLSLIGLTASFLLPFLLVTPICFDVVPGIEMYALGAGPYPMGAPRVARNGLAQDYLVYLTILDVSCVVVPSFITVICYFSIWIFIRKRRRVQKSHTALNTAMEETMKKRIRAAKMSCIIAVLFFISYYPYMISVTVRRAITPDKNQLAETNGVIVVSWLFWCGSCINPFVYIFLSTEFRVWFARVRGRLCGGFAPTDGDSCSMELRSALGQSLLATVKLSSDMQTTHGLSAAQG